jgi:hypothetical protein
MKLIPRVWIAFADALPSLTFVAIGGFMIAAAIWIVPSEGSLSTVLVILGSGQLTLGVVVSRIETFSLGLGGVRGVLRAVEKKGRLAGLNRHEIGYAAADAVALAFHSPLELSAAVASEIAGDAIEQELRRRAEAPEPTEEEPKRLKGLGSAEEEPKRLKGLGSAEEEPKRLGLGPAEGEPHGLELEADEDLSANEQDRGQAADPSRPT